jgi:putative ABC transport system substrate-binding protein
MIAVAVVHIPVSGGIVRVTVVAVHVLAVSLLAMPLIAQAQSAAKMSRIGYLTAGGNQSFPQLPEAFRQGLRELGYVEGKNIVIEYRAAEGMPDRLPVVAAELVRLKVDVIVTGGGTPPALAAKQATRTIPIVAIAVGDPVTSGLVSSLGRPGGNVTGLALLFPELIGKGVEQLKLAVPKANRVALLWQPGAVPERTEKDVLKEAELAAQALGVQLQPVPAQSPGDIDGAFAEITRGRAAALVVASTPMFARERHRIIGLAAKNRLAAVYSFKPYVEDGGFMSYGPDLTEISRRAATYVDKILRGAKPAELPVEQPTKFELAINLKTAKALGLTLPPSLLGRADLVVE